MYSVYIIDCPFTMFNGSCTNVYQTVMYLNIPSWNLFKNI